MSRGKNLQEMEVGTKQSKTAVNAGAKAGDPMPKLTTGIPDGQSGNWEDLGGPTPQNSRPDDDSNKLKDPAAILQQVRDVVNRGAKAADPMKHLAKGAVKEEEELDDEDLIDEDLEDEVVEEAAETEDEDEEKSSKKKSKKGEEEDEDEEDEDEEDESMKEQIEAIETQIEEDVEALLSGEELSEEFKFKAKTVFEAALNARTEQIEEAILQKYEQQLSEEVEAFAASLTESLTERVDSYLEYVAQEWMEENEIALEQGLRAEMTESFLNNLKNLFEDHYVTIPEERYDVLESMVEKLDDMETKLNEQIERNIALNKRLAESVTDVIFGEVSEGLALSQKDKLASLAENVEFDGEEEYREKLVTLRESYFPSSAGTPRNTQDYLVEETTETVQYQSTSRTMDAYLNALGKVSKK